MISAELLQRNVSCMSTLVPQLSSSREPISSVTSPVPSADQNHLLSRVCFSSPSYLFPMHPNTVIPSQQHLRQESCSSSSTTTSQQHFKHYNMMVKTEDASSGCLSGTSMPLSQHHMGASGSVESGYHGSIGPASSPYFPSPISRFHATSGYPMRHSTPSHSSLLLNQVPSCNNNFWPQFTAGPSASYPQEQSPYYSPASNLPYTPSFEARADPHFTTETEDDDNEDEEEQPPSPAAAVMPPFPYPPPFYSCHEQVSQHLRLEQKRRKNREAAKRCRQKRLLKIEDLATQCRQLREQVNLLQHELSVERRINTHCLHVIREFGLWDRLSDEYKNFALLKLQQQQQSNTPVTESLNKKQKHDVTASNVD